MMTRRIGAAVALLCIFVPQNLWAQETEAATRQYAAATGFQNSKLFDSAIDEWQTFIRKFPNDPRVPLANHYLGICCVQEKRFSDAIRALTVVVKDHPRFEKLDQSALNLGIAWYGYAQKSGKESDFSNAERAFDLMLTKFPDSQYAPTAMYYRGESLFEQGKRTQAAGAYAELLQKFPRDKNAADATYALGTTLEEMKKPREAQTVFASFESKYPGHPLLTEVRMRQAELLFNDKQYKRALPLFEQVAEKSDFELADVAMLRHARCLYEDGQLLAAAKRYWNVPRAFRNTKHYDAAILAGAKCYFLEGRYQTARSGLEKIAGRDQPEAAEATQWLARSYLKEDDPEAALRIADRGLRRFRGDEYRPELEMVRLDALYEIPNRKPEAVSLYARFAARNRRHELAPQAQYMAALTALEVRDHKQARQHAEKFLATYSDHELAGDVLFVSAESHLLIGEHSDAIDRYRTFLRKNPRHENAPQANLRLGLAMHLASDHDAAIEWLSRISQSLPDQELRSEALSILGRSYLETEQTDAAARALQQSVQLDPKRSGNDETLLALADAYRKLNRHDDATRQLESVLRQYPQSELLDEVWYRLGEAAYADEDHDAAIGHYQQVVRRFPDSEFAPHAQYGLGWTLFSNEQFRDATTAMTRLIDRYGDSKVGPRGYYVRAMAAYQLGEYSDVLRDVDKFLATEPERNDALDARYVRGLAQAGQKNYAAASQTYASILKSGRGYPAGDKVAYELGWALMELGRTQEAADAFRRLSSDWPDSPLAGESLFRVGESFYEAEKYTDAARSYRESADKAKTAEIAEKSLHKLGWSHLKADDPAAADRAFREQLREHPGGELAGDARFLTGECRFRQEDWTSALTAYRQVIDSGDTNYLALATFRAGECAGSLQDWRTSRTYHQKVLADFPDFEMIPEARYGLAWALQHEGRYDQAVRLYEKVTEETQTETAAKARFMIGECFFAQKQHKEASRHFLKAAFAYNHPEWSPLSWFEAGRCFEVLRDTAQAKNCYQQLIAKFPKHSKVKAAQARLKALGE